MLNCTEKAVNNFLEAKLRKNKLCLNRSHITTMFLKAYTQSLSQFSNLDPKNENCKALHKSAITLNYITHQRATYTYFLLIHKRRNAFRAKVKDKK